jgi:hypothetical protein
MLSRKFREVDTAMQFYQQSPLNAMCADMGQHFQT